MTDALLEESSIAVLPGSDFYMPATSLSVRVAAVDFDGARVLKSWPGVDHVTEKYLREFLPKIEQGCEYIEGFLKLLN